MPCARIGYRCDKGKWENEKAKSGVDPAEIRLSFASTMTDEDLQRLETAIARPLPDEYRRFLLDPHFAKESCTYESLGLFDVGWLIERNQWMQAKATWNSNLQPRDRYLFIGSDFGSSMYVMDLESDTLTIRYADAGRTQEIHKSYGSFAEFLREMARMDQEAADDDARAAAASPWPGRLILTAFILLCILYVVYRSTWPLQPL
jgi:hypothetical protein